MEGLPMRLLLVEDEIRLAQALCEILHQEQYDVDHFADGLEGLLALETGVYDLAVLDVMLPGKNGFNIAAAARREGIRTPILMLTAKSELSDKVAGLDFGADDYLTKPFFDAGTAGQTAGAGTAQLSDPGWGAAICGYPAAQGFLHTVV